MPNFKAFEEIWQAHRANLRIEMRLMLCLSTRSSTARVDCNDCASVRYMKWLFAQLDGAVNPDIEDRDDVTTVKVRVWGWRNAGMPPLHRKITENL